MHGGAFLMGAWGGVFMPAVGEPGVRMGVGREGSGVGPRCLKVKGQQWAAWTLQKGGRGAHVRTTCEVCRGVCVSACVHVGVTRALVRYTGSGVWVRGVPRVHTCVPLRPCVCPWVGGWCLPLVWVFSVFLGHVHVWLVQVPVCPAGVWRVGGLRPCQGAFVMGPGGPVRRSVKQVLVTER